MLIPSGIVADEIPGTNTPFSNTKVNALESIVTGFRVVLFSIFVAALIAAILPTRVYFHASFRVVGKSFVNNEIEALCNSSSGNFNEVGLRL